MTENDTKKCGAKIYLKGNKQTCKITEKECFINDMKHLLSGIERGKVIVLVVYSQNIVLVSYKTRTCPLLLNLVSFLDTQCALCLDLHIQSTSN